jgi:hypothetical protein
MDASCLQNRTMWSGASVETGGRSMQTTVDGSA